MTKDKQTLRFVFDVSPLEGGRLHVEAHIGLDGEEGPRQSGSVEGTVEQVVEASMRLWQTTQIMVLALTDISQGKTELRCRDEERELPEVMQFLRSMSVAMKEVAAEDGSLQYVVGEELAGGLQ